MIQDNYQLPELVQQVISSNDLSTTGEYSVYNDRKENGPVIPGIFQGAVPQGLAYYREADLMLISSYMFDGRPSTVTAVSMANGELVKNFWLLAPDGTPFKGHVGGLAVSNKYLWIASGKGVYNIPLKDIAVLENNTQIVMGEFIPTEVKGSFASFSNGILWVGEFTSRDGSYTTSRAHHFRTLSGDINHALLAGYKLDSYTDSIKKESIINGIAFPDYIISIPHEVQGAVFIGGRIIFSQSYGRKNNSRISVYREPLGEKSVSTLNTSDGRTLPVWILGEDNLETEITAPPMTEGLSLYNGQIAVLFESGSDKYRNSAKNPMDSIDLLTLFP